MTNTCHSVTVRRLIPLLILLLLAASCSSAGDNLDVAADDTTTTTSRAQRTTGTRARSETTIAKPPTTAASGAVESSESTPGLLGLDVGDPGDDMSGLTGERTLGSIGDPTFPGLGNTGYDVQSYSIALDLTGVELVAETTVDLVASVDLTKLHLDLVGMEVDEIRVDDEPALFNRNARELIVRLPNPLTEGERASIFWPTTEHRHRSTPVTRFHSTWASKPARGEASSHLSPSAQPRGFPGTTTLRTRRCSGSN